MKLFAIVSNLLAFPSTISAISNSSLELSPRQGGCSNPAIRQEWSSVSQETRNSYTQAVMCLTTQPSRIGLSTSRFDDYTWVHRQLFDDIHVFGTEVLAIFLPWHRYFTHLYELELQSCGYTGNMLYWDWAASAPSPFTATIFSNDLGLGGDGDQAGSCIVVPGQSQRCVDSGPFANLKPAYFQEAEFEHNLMRCFTCGSTTMFNESWTGGVIDEGQMVGDYRGYTYKLYVGPHLSIHDAIGGDFPQTTSPNEPLFWPHHAQVDRLWWKWQQQDRDNRLYEYDGVTVTGASNPGPASISDMMQLLGLAPDMPVSEVMDTEGGYLCYRYDG